MELKLLKVDNLHHAVGVLIVPLWNWNFISENVKFLVERSNRTFMELKLRIMK